MAAVPTYEIDVEKIRKSNPFMTNTTLVYNYLRNNIVEHKIAQGQKLNQEQVAIDLNVSRTPVRDAFSMLEEEGFLEKGQQGYKVQEMQAGDYMMLLDVRTMHEVLAVKLACSRILGSEKHQIEANLELLDQIVELAERKAWDDDCHILNEKLANMYMDELCRIDHDFHNLVVFASHNDYLIESYHRLDPKIQFFRRSAFNVNAAQNMKDRHRQIFEAIVARDDQRAQDYMKNHLAITMNRAINY